MNRLVIIGNGFDLAHGLKTSYKNFILWYWAEWANRLLHGSNKEEKDKLCSFELKDDIGLQSWYLVWGHYYKRINPVEDWQTCDILDKVLFHPEVCNFPITSTLLQKIWKNLLSNWVDIENEYYKLLTLQLSPVRDIGKCVDPKTLNSDLDFIKTKLIEYLRIEEKKEIKALDSIREKIYCPIVERDIAIENLKSIGIGDSVNKAPDRIMMLSFNYTKTEHLYVNPNFNVQVNHIHGCLDEEDNVIFGYGDEMSDDFIRFKELNDNECLRNMKSIRYMEAANYRKMLSFIESAPFQVCIMGHSCGNSDRTLLNTIFEHKNCVSIKPYFYIKYDGTDRYIELIQNISRNFNDMKLMRDRVVNKTYCEPLVPKSK